MRYLTRIAVIAVVATLCCGCFKEEKQGTRMLIQLWSQNVKSDPIMITPETNDIESYAFYVEKGTKWDVTTWEDALNRVITNEDDQSQLTNPQVIGTYTPGAEFQVALELWSQYTFLVIVDKTNEIYATRLYETPMNLPVVETYLHLYAHKSGGPANGWDMVNPFPDKEREPLQPVEEDEEQGENSDENSSVTE
ncbi:MAG: hypothetical protein J6Q95_02035 [Alistipes sp.]|nr:hypothetical protein [Alistipes sp.]